MQIGEREGRGREGEGGGEGAGGGEVGGESRRFRHTHIFNQRFLLHLKNKVCVCVWVYVWGGGWC